MNGTPLEPYKSFIKMRRNKFINLSTQPIPKLQCLSDRIKENF